MPVRTQGEVVSGTFLDGSTLYTGERLVRVARSSPTPTRSHPDGSYPSNPDPAGERRKSSPEVRRSDGYAFH